MRFLKSRLAGRKKRIIGWLFTSLVGAVGLTWRVRFYGRAFIDDLTAKKKPFVIVFWHGDMLMGWYFHRNRKYSSLVSMSRDGDLLAEILRQWKYTVIRGSSSKGGKDARARMEHLLRKGHVLVVTPDGPQGPRYEMKMGALRTAQKTGVPIVSVTFQVDRALFLNTWDKFTIPLPFTRIIVTYRAPEMVHPELNGDDLNEYREDFEKRMKPGIVST